MSPHGGAPHGATSWQAMSPGTAKRPGPQGSAGRIGAQPPAWSDTKPAAQASGGTPTTTQPFTDGISFAAHTTGSGGRATVSDSSEPHPRVAKSAQNSDRRQPIRPSYLELEPSNSG